MSVMVPIKVKKLSATAQLPRYAHTGEFGDLAADVYASDSVTLAPCGNPGSTAAVPTGIALEFPSTHGALVEDRSGLAVRGIRHWPAVSTPASSANPRLVAPTSPPRPS